MTNKLPVVGKRYKPKNLNLRNFYKFEYETIAVTKKNIAVKIVRSDFKHLLETIKVYNINSIKNKLEELPEDKAETQPETQSHISELSPEVKEAMEELRREIALCGGGFNQSPQTELERKGMEIFYYFLSKSQNLLNALDKQFKVNETSESVDVKKEEVKEKIQPDENGSFKHIDGIEEETQDLMKKDIFGK